jgi:Protein of unknown function (DUF3562)
MESQAVEFGTPRNQQDLLAIAHRMNRPVEEVLRVYKLQFDRLEREARIRTFLPILAARNARRILSGKADSTR